MSKPSVDIAKTSLRLSEAQWEALIDRLEAGKGPVVPATRDRRDLDHRRFFHVRRAALRVLHRSAPPTSHLVRTRNLSEGGVGLIHNAFLYPGTACHVALQTRHDESVALRGNVSWCRHVSGRGHEVGVRFDRVIEIDEFIAPGERRAQPDAA
ncbi:MAG: PilZ domain-containing protein [Planctomycetota bacterium]